MLNLSDLSKIGMGTWGIGGFAEPDPTIDAKKQAEGIAYALQAGINFVELNYWNSKGRSVEIFREGLAKSGICREDLLVVQSIYNYSLPTIEAVYAEADRFLSDFGTNYVDSIQLLLTSIKVYGLDVVIKFFYDRLNSGKAKYISVTNFNLEYLERFQKEFGDRLFSHACHVSFEARVNEQLGITKFASDHGIKNVIFQSLRRNRTNNLHWPLLDSLASKYSATPNQIVLSWLLSKGYLPILKTETISHIDENLQSVDVKLSPTDILQIENFSLPNVNNQPIDWFLDGKGTFIANFPNFVDEWVKERL